MLRHTLGVMPGHSRPKDGVASLANDPGIHPFEKLDRRVKPGGDGGVSCRRDSYFWHTGQKNVERPFCTIRLIVPAQPRVGQRSPSRS